MNSISKITLILSAFLLISPVLAQKNQIKPVIHQAIEKVDINHASAETLSTVLSGVGLKKAQAIVIFRQEKGPFKKLQDLALVKGIGLATVEKNKAKITL